LPAAVENASGMSTAKDGAGRSAASTSSNASSRPATAAHTRSCKWSSDLLPAGSPTPPRGQAKERRPSPPEGLKPGAMIKTDGFLLKTARLASNAACSSARPHSPAQEGRLIKASMETSSTAQRPDDTSSQAANSELNPVQGTLPRTKRMDGVPPRGSPLPPALPGQKAACGTGKSPVAAAWMALRSAAPRTGTLDTAAAVGRNDAADP